MVTTILTKRAISLDEKKTVLEKDGDALTFMGEGDEIAELILPEFEIEWNPARVHAIEGYSKKDEHGAIIDSKYDRIARVQAKYPETFPGNYIAKMYKSYLNCGMAGKEWTYVHLDYYGVLTQERLQEFARTARFIEHGGRLRVTYLIDDKYRGAKHKYGTDPEKLVDVLMDSIAHEFLEYINHEVYLGTNGWCKMFTMWMDKI